MEVPKAEWLDEDYINSLDKRTKEYKEYKAWNKSSGLGDTVEKITKATGIKKVVDTVSDALGIDCGCDKRKEKLNKIFPYKRPECLTDEEYNKLDKFFGVKRVKVTHEDQKELLEIYNRVFRTKKRITSCPPCVRTMVDELKKVWLEHTT